MIQRAQSVFLLISAMALGVFLGTNSFTKAISATESVTVNAFHVFHKVGGSLGTDKPIFYLAVMASIAIVVSLLAIFQYKNRLRQIMFVAFNSLLMGATLATTVYFIFKEAKEMGAAGDETFEAGFFALIVAMISNSVANYFIKKDEKLVRSADRMR